VELYTLDDLREGVVHAQGRREAEVPAAHALIASEVTRFTDWMHRRELLAAPPACTRRLDQGPQSANQGERPGSSRAQPTPRASRVVERRQRRHQPERTRS
jgi:glutamyl-tRNA reductase